MQLRWTAKAEDDLVRLHDFLTPVNPQAALRIVRQIVAAARTLSDHPQLGRPMTEFAPQDVRRLIVGDYEMRYMIAGTAIHILRLWHVREDR